MPPVTLCLMFLCFFCSSMNVLFVKRFLKLHSEVHTCTVASNLSGTNVPQLLVSLRLLHTDRLVRRAHAHNRVLNVNDATESEQPINVQYANISLFHIFFSLRFSFRSKIEICDSNASVFVLGFLNNRIYLFHSFLALVHTFCFCVPL